MSRTKPCMLCNAPLDNDECRTPGCAFNPAAEMEVHDSEWTYDENAHQEVGEFDPEDLPHADEGDPDPEFVNADLPDTGDLEGDFSDPEAEQKEAAEDADTMNLSQEDLPEDDLTREEREDLEKEGQEKPKDQQLTEEDKGEDPSDDAMNLEDAPEDDDPDLPPKPQGCSGDCQPGELGEDGDPCPHCTAKSFKQEMEEQGKQHQSEEEMEQDWQNFIDDWQKQAGDDQQGNGQGDQGDEDVKDLPGEHEPEGEQKLEDRQPPDLADDDDDLPPRPQGCQGDCKPGNQFDDDADPCPHCTAKSFRDEMLDEIEDTEGEDLAHRRGDRGAIPRFPSGLAGAAVDGAEAPGDGAGEGGRAQARRNRRGAARGRDAGRHAAGEAGEEGARARGRLGRVQADGREADGHAGEALRQHRQADREEGRVDLRADGRGRLRAGQERGPVQGRGNLAIDSDYV